MYHYRISVFNESIRLRFFLLKVKFKKYRSLISCFTLPHLTWGSKARLFANITCLDSYLHFPSQCVLTVEYIGGICYSIFRSKPVMFVSLKQFMKLRKKDCQVHESHLKAICLFQKTRMNGSIECTMNVEKHNL